MTEIGGDEDDSIVEDALELDVALLGEDEQTLSDARTLVEEAMAIIDTDTTNIRYQLDKARADVITLNKYADTKWWRSANSALRHKGIMRGKLQNKFGEINRRLRMVRSHSERLTRDRIFVKLASKLLKPAQVRSIWKEVDQSTDGVTNECRDPGNQAR
jgi:hypothetical protein